MATSASSASSFISSSVADIIDADTLIEAELAKEMSASISSSITISRSTLSPSVVEGSLIKEAESLFSRSSPVVPKPPIHKKVVRIYDRLHRFFYIGEKEYEESQFLTFCISTRQKFHYESELRVERIHEPHDGSVPIKGILKPWSQNWIMPLESSDDDSDPGYERRKTNHARTQAYKNY